MPRVLRPFVAFALCAIFGAACAPSAPTPTGGGVAPPVVPAIPQTLTFGEAELTSILDPHHTIGTAKYPIFEGLLLQDDSGAVVAGLASAWKSIDARTWQFTLATGRKFHDGSPVTAEAVKWNYDRSLDAANRLAIRARIATIEKVEVVDSRTVNLVTIEPDPILLKRAAILKILSKEQFDKVGDRGLILDPMPTGQYKLKEFRPNDRIVLVPNSEHPKPGTLSELVIRGVPDTTARVNGLRSGEIDVADVLSVEQADNLKGAGFDIIAFNQGSSYGAWMDTTLEGSPTRDKRVRQALNYAVDKDAIAKTIYRGFTRPEQGQLIQSRTFGFNPNLKPYPYDPRKARELLAAAGYPNGFKMKIDVNTNVPNADQVWQFVQQQFKDIGIEAELFTYGDNAVYLDRFYARVARAPIMNTRITNLPALDADFAYTWYSGKQPVPGRLYNNPEFDRLYDASRVEMNEGRRGELLQQAGAVLHEDPAHLFLVEGFSLWGVSKKVTGLRARADNTPGFELAKRVS